ncbi:MAG: DUF1566 domain-containing protein [Arcobacteraceae bacterium]
MAEQKKEKITSVRDVAFVQDALMWQDDKDTKKLKLNRLELKFYCKDLTLAKRKDWRVPTYEEMITLIAFSKSNPASKDIVTKIESSQYWTSTVSVLEKDKNWFVDFKYGKSDITSDLVQYNIRCVRDLSTKEGDY